MFKGFRIWLASAAIIPWAAIATDRAPVSTANAEHYTWGNCCQAWYLVKTDALTVIQEERMPPGTAEVLHRHNCSRQFLYVLAGSAAPWIITAPVQSCILRKELRSLLGLLTASRTKGKPH